MEAATTTPTVAEDVTFISKSRDIRFSIIKGYELKNAMGDITERSPHFDVQFADQRLTTDMMRDQAASQGFIGERAEEVVNKAIKTIRESEHYNVSTSFGVWEEGKAPDEPRPTVSEMNEAIAQATAQRSPEALDEIISFESENHNRSVVLQAARSAKKAIEALEE